MDEIKVGDLVEITQNCMHKGLRLRVVNFMPLGSDKALLSYSAGDYEDDYGKPLEFYKNELKVINGS